MLSERRARAKHKLASLSRRFRHTSRATFAYLRSTLESGWWFGVAPNQKPNPRAITSRWISFVPSPISSTFWSR
jgi:hypothetical protein